MLVLGAGLLGIGWFASGAGPRFLHRQLESALSRRLARTVSVEAIDLRLDRGLRLSLRNLRIASSLEPTKTAPTPRPDARSERDPALLRAGHAVAWIDIPALLIGRLALGTIRIEGAHLRVERAADGSFPGLGLPPLAEGAPAERDEVFGEGLVQAVESLEPLAQRAAERVRIASRLELRDATLSFVDGLRPPETPPLRLELVGVTAHRSWLSEAGALELEAVVVDGKNAPFPIRFRVAREEERPFVWDLSWDGVSLASAQQLVPSLPVVAGLGGRWSAKLHAERLADGTNVLDLASQVTNASLVLPHSRRRLAWDALDLSARIELAEDEVRVRAGRVGGNRIRGDYALTVDRPLRPASKAKLETRLVGVEFSDLRTLAESVRDEIPTARSLARLIEPVEAGRIERIEAAGSAPLSQWQALWRGPERVLPEGFLLAGAFDSVDVGGDDALRSLAGEVEWVGEKLALRELRARHRGAWLPRMDLSITGVSQLARVMRKGERSERIPPAIPGLRPLAQILRPRDPNALPPVKAIGLAIERLEHPLLRWPLRDAKVLVEPIRRGVQIQIREGLLGGATISGEVVYRGVSPDAAPAPAPDAADPARRGESRVTADLVFDRPTRASESSASPSAFSPAPAVTSAAQVDWPAERWAAGEIEMEFRPRPTLPFARAKGFFRLDGTDFEARDVEIALEKQGTIETRGVVGLEAPDSIGLELAFALTDGRFDHHSRFFALPEKLITGGMQVTGNLAGRVRPGAVFIAELDGDMRAEAVDGRVALAVPLLLRLAKATEGYNPFADEDEIGFERMAATIDLRHGLLESQDFVLEGPLRAYAKAAIDTNPRPVDIRAVVGIFLFRAPNQVLKNVPILRSLLPGSERGLVGAYFRVDGPIGEPDVEALPLATFLTAVPDAIKAPLRVIQFLFGRGDRDEDAAKP